MAAKPTAADKLRAQHKEALMARIKQGASLSSGVRSYFKANLEGVNFWAAKEGDHVIDIIPYFAGPDDPNVKEGGLTYLLEIFVHRDVGGIENQTMICMERTYKKPCAICEHRKALQKEGADEDLIKSLQPSRYPRSVYNVVVYDSEKDEAKGVQIFDTSHYLFEMYLAKLAHPTTRGGQRPQAFITFADAEDGKSIRFTRTGQRENTKFIAHAFEDRNYTISAEILAQAKQLDQLIHIPSYDEVYNAYWGETPAEEALPKTVREPVRSARVATTSVAPTEEEEPAAPEAEAEEPGEPEVEAEAPEPTMEEILAGMDRAALKAFIADQKLNITVYKQWDDQRVRDEILKALGGSEAEEPGEPDAPPAAPPARPAATKGSTTASASASIACPGGGIFGVNLNELQHCEVCKVWDACLAENEKETARKQAAAARAPVKPTTAGRGAPRTPPAKK